MTTQRHILLIKIMPWVLLAAAVLSTTITAILVAKDMASWNLAWPLGFALLASYSVVVVGFIRPRCDKCNTRMKLLHDESLSHRCPKCSFARRSDYVIPESSMPD